MPSSAKIVIAAINFFIRLRSLHNGDFECARRMRDKSKSRMSACWCSRSKNHCHSRQAQLMQSPGQRPTTQYSCTKHRVTRFRNVTLSASTSQLVYCRVPPESVDPRHSRGMHQRANRIAPFKEKRPPTNQCTRNGVPQFSQHALASIPATTACRQSKEHRVRTQTRFPRLRNHVRRLNKLIATATIKMTAPALQ